MRAEGKKVQANGITEGVIWKQLLRFFFPIVLGTFFQQLYNTVDAIVVGNYVGKEALAAVGGTTATLINLLVGFFIGLSSGATVVISQYFGARDEENVHKSVHTAIAMAIAGGLLLSVAGYFVSPVALKWMNTPAEILPGATTYIRVYFMGVVFVLLYNIGAGILRAIGDSRRPLFVLIFCCITNAGLDILFVKEMGMGVAGAAYATMITQAASALILMVILMRSRESYRLRPRKVRVHVSLLRDILHIGFPAGLQSMLYAVTNVFIQSSINHYGTNYIAGWTAYGKVDSLFWMIMDAFAISITTFTGQNIGARKMDRVRKGIVICCAMALAFSLAFSGVLALFGEQVIGLFNDDPEVITAARRLMNCIYPFFFTYVAVGVLGGALRGAGDSLRPMLMIAGGICGFRLVWFAVARVVNADITGLVMSYPVSWALTSVIFIVYYLRGRWVVHARNLHR